jgi:hypothetical protein
MYLYDYRYSLASQIKSRIALIGHAAAEGSGPPSYRRPNQLIQLTSLIFSLISPPREVSTMV